MPNLEFSLIKEIIAHGASYDPSRVVDPSVNSILNNAGLARVATYIEQLSLLDLVTGATAMFGAAGGMWIGYKLTEEGRRLAASDMELRFAVAELTGDARSEVSSSVKELRAECETAAINANYREEFLHTLDEIGICFDDECYIATIGLCGKILEVCLKEILYQNNIEIPAQCMIGQLIKLINQNLPRIYTDPALVSLADIINRSRITAVHATERVPIPSRDQAVMVIFATRDVVRRYLSQIS